MIKGNEIDVGQVMENVNYRSNKEVRIKSTELVGLINDFRNEEGKALNKKVVTLQHRHFIAKIKREIDVMESLGLRAEPNICPGEYRDKNNQVRPCYSLNRDGMLQILNSESVIVRAKTIEYINKLEEQLKKPRTLSAREELKLHYQMMEEQDEKLTELDNKVDYLENNIPLFNVECKELQALVRKIGVRTLGGYGSPAYTDNSIRGKVYADIHSQLKREFGVSRYEAIKRVQLDQAMGIVKNYKAPLILQERVRIANKQMKILEGGK